MPALVTLHVWGVPSAAVPRAALRMATQRRGLARLPGLTFAKLLGTGRSFSPRDADLRHWALLACWAHPGDAALLDSGPVGLAWRRIATETLAVRMHPLASRGRWSGREPFGAPAPRRWDGPVAAVTRARLAPRRVRAFWRAVPPVAADVHAGEGPLLTLGIGEAPLGLQGTFSLWPSVAALTDFAYRRPAHARVVAATPREGWYAEELFARFAVQDVQGRLHGTAVTLAAGATGAGRAAGAAGAALPGELPEPASGTGQADGAAPESSRPRIA